MSGSRAARRVAAFLALAATALVLALSPLGWTGEGVSVASAAPAIKLTKMFSGFTQPLFMAQPNDGTNRYFVVERAGRILAIVNGVHQSTPFLDLRTRIISTGTEQG